MAYEDFTTYDETDEAGDITITSSKVEWSSMNRFATSHVSKSMGIDHFGGDFSHQFVVNFSAISGYAVVYTWCIANAQGDYKTLTDTAADFMVFGLSGSAYEFQLIAKEDGVSVWDKSSVFTAGTDYYVTIARDDDGGANSTGQVVATIRTVSHTGTVFDTLTVDCSTGEQNDFQYVYGVMSFDDAGAGWVSGYLENLDLNEASSGVALPVAMNHYKGMR